MITWALLFAVGGIAVALLSNVVATWIEPGLRRFKVWTVAIFAGLGVVFGAFVDKTGLALPLEPDAKTSAKVSEGAESVIAPTVQVPYEVPREFLDAWSKRLREEGAQEVIVRESIERMSKDLAALRAQVALWAAHSEAASRALPYIDRGDFNAAVNALRATQPPTTSLQPQAAPQPAPAATVTPAPALETRILVQALPAQDFSRKESIVPSVACDAPAVTLRVLALERGSPGELRMEVDFESLANIPQSVNLDKRRTALVDNTGYMYKVIKSPRETRLLPGARTRADYVFLSEVGGQHARTVSMDIRFGVRSDRSYRPCSFVVPGISIAEVQR